MSYKNLAHNDRFDLKIRTELSAPPDTIYFGFDQSQSCTLSSCPSKSNNGAFGLRISQSLTQLSYEPDMNKKPSVVDQQTDCTHCVCPVYVFLTMVPAVKYTNCIDSL